MPELRVFRQRLGGELRGRGRVGNPIDAVDEYEQDLAKVPARSSQQRQRAHIDRTQQLASKLVAGQGLEDKRRRLRIAKAWTDDDIRAEAGNGRRRVARYAETPSHCHAGRNSADLEEVRRAGITHAHDIVQKLFCVGDLRRFVELFTRIAKNTARNRSAAADGDGNG